MAWNNAKRRAKFEADAARFAEKCRALGMSEEAIAEMYVFDLREFNNTRRYYERNRQIPDDVFDKVAEGICPPNAGYLEKFSTTIEKSDKSRSRWIDEIDDAGLAERLKTLTHEEVELITLYAYDRFTQAEIGRMLGISQMAVSKRIGKVRKKLGKRF